MISCRLLLILGFIVIFLIIVPQFLKFRQLLFSLLNNLLVSFVDLLDGVHSFGQLNRHVLHIHANIYFSN